jgi:hypothetical protein
LCRLVDAASPLRVRARPRALPPAELAAGRVGGCASGGYTTNTLQFMRYTCDLDTGMFSTQPHEPFFPLEFAGNYESQSSNQSVMFKYMLRDLFHTNQTRKKNILDETNAAESPLLVVECILDAVLAERLDQPRGD